MKIVVASHNKKKIKELNTLLDKYIDDAKRAGVKSLRIIHGKGTGALRKAVTDFLRRDARIASVRIGSYGEGDTGVSIAELK